MNLRVLRRIWRWGIGTTLLLSVYVYWSILTTYDRSWSLVVWVAVLGLFVVAGLAAARAEPRRADDTSTRSQPNPYAGWPYLFIILAGAGLLYMTAPLDMPVRTDAFTAQLGIGARTAFDNNSTDFVTLPQTGLSRYAYYPTALAEMITGDGLLSVRLVGGYAGLLSVLATWLLGCELFRRAPLYGGFGETIEDDGRWIALLAALIAAFGVPFMHFGRIPVFLESVSWGTLGLWALLRGVRLKHFPSLGLSGLLLGLASVFSSGGLFFVWLSLVWWCGVWLLQRTWMVAGSGVQVTHPEKPGERDAQGSAWSGLLYWTVGLVVVMLPLIAVLISEGTPFSAYLQTAWGGIRNAEAPVQEVIDTLWPRIRTISLAFTVLPDQSAVFGFDGHLVNSLLAPVFVLAIGGLLLNLDTIAGWVLLSWLGGGMLIISLFGQQAPAWPALLLLWPAVSLAIAFGFDRIRVAWMASAGTWSVQATVYLAIGLVISAGMLNWIDYYEHAQLGGDAPSYLGRALRTLGSEKVALVVPDGGSNVTEDPVVDFLTNGDVHSGRIIAVKEQDLPDIGEEVSRIVLLPRHLDLQRAVELQYPIATLTVERNLRGDPTIFIYDMASSRE